MLKIKTNENLFFLIIIFILNLKKLEKVGFRVFSINNYFNFKMRCKVSHFILICKHLMFFCARI